MISRPERREDRDAALVQALDSIPEHGWSIASLRAADPGLADLDLLFPGGAADLIEAFFDLADRQMEDDATAADFAGMGLTKRVRAVIALRLARQRPQREAIRRALGVLALPLYAGLSARITARTVDSIWYAAGDQSSDFSWYTKRAILAAVYGATTLYWLRDFSEDDADSLAFLDRRLAGVGKIGKARGKVMGIAEKIRQRGAGRTDPVTAL
jgi:ubiquinone biosynthesis protein COQ9